MSLEFFFVIFGALITVVNPIGAIPMYLSLTGDFTNKERNDTALNTSIYFILILLSFFFAGSSILNFFGISINAMRIAGGLIILTTGYALLSGKFEESRAINKAVKAEAKTKSDVSFSPLAMPLLSGPGSISLLVGWNTEYTEWDKQLLIAGAVIFTGAMVYLVLRFAPFSFKVLGHTGLKAISRIMGFIVMAIAIQYIITGIVSLVTDLIPNV
jgi:multiple antibiotic resistance protein